MAFFVGIVVGGSGKGQSSLGFIGCFTLFEE